MKAEGHAFSGSITYSITYCLRKNLGHSYSYHCGVHFSKYVAHFKTIKTHIHSSIATCILSWILFEISIRLISFSLLHGSNHTHWFQQISVGYSYKLQAKWHYAIMTISHDKLKAKLYYWFLPAITPKLAMCIQNEWWVTVGKVTTAYLLFNAHFNISVVCNSNFHACRTNYPLK